MSWPGKLLITFENFTAGLPALTNDKSATVCPSSCDCQCKCCRGFSQKYVAFNGEPVSSSSTAGDVQKMMRLSTVDMLLLLHSAQARDNFWTNNFYKANLQEDYQAIGDAFASRRRQVDLGKLEAIMDTITAGYRRAVGLLRGAEAHGELRPSAVAASYPGLRCGCLDCEKWPWRTLQQVVEHQREHNVSDNWHCRMCYRSYYLQHMLSAHLKRDVRRDGFGQLMEDETYKQLLKDQKKLEVESFQSRPKVQEMIISTPEGVHLDFEKELRVGLLKRKRCYLSNCPRCNHEYHFPFSHQLHMRRHQEQRKNTTRSCPTCWRSFRTRVCLLKHQKRARLVCRLRYRPFKCRSCRWRFQMWSALKSHVLRLHQRRKPCLICQMPTVSRCCCSHSAKECRDAIKKHREMLRLQRGPPKVDRKQPKPVCGICSQELSNNFLLKVHMNKKHLHRRDFSCEICGLAFYSQGLMQVHRKAVHLMTKKIHCEVCDLTIKDKSNYKRHCQSQRHLDQLVKASKERCETLEVKPFKSQRSGVAVHCETCNVTLKGDINQHLQTIKHKRNVTKSKEIKAEKKDSLEHSSVRQEAVVGPEPCRFQKPEKVNYCGICDHTIIGTMQKHLKSGKHRNNLMNDKGK
ncbi:zinc finger protein 728 isoform X1 [Drosophila subobscura]|uniref:zinc finger protein 728 isoform X1 n=1 Tax=Drosophila subobscura TaxID=7241 RepID=UPI00155A9766|nr:zinc finger protein 728 isoform X1 [Drosophila subobscura]